MVRIMKKNRENLIIFGMVVCLLYFAIVLRNKDLRGSEEIGEWCSYSIDEMGRKYETCIKHGRCGDTCTTTLVNETKEEAKEIT